jgi:hypothetical protein
MAIVEHESDVIFDHAQSFGRSIGFGIENTDDSGVPGGRRGSIGSSGGATICLRSGMRLTPATRRGSQFSGGVLIVRHNTLSPWKLTLLLTFGIMPASGNPSIKMCTGELEAGRQSQSLLSD